MYVPLDQVGAPIEENMDTLNFLYSRILADQMDATTRAEFLSSHERIDRGAGNLSQQPLHELMQATRTTQASDPRDKVYSLLGLVKDHPESHRIVPDYEKPVAEVFAMAARIAVEKSNRLDELSCSFDRMYRRVPDVPTWVPDYSVPGMSSIRHVKFAAAGKLPLALDETIGSAWNTLRVEAAHWDIVTQIGRPRSVVGGSSKFDFDGSWFEMVSSIGDEYITGQPRTEVLLAHAHRQLWSYPRSTCRA